MSPCLGGRMGASQSAFRPALGDRLLIPGMPRFGAMALARRAPSQILYEEGHHGCQMRVHIPSPPLRPCARADTYRRSRTCRFIHIHPAGRPRLADPPHASRFQGGLRRDETIRTQHRDRWIHPCRYMMTGL